MALLLHARCDAANLCLAAPNLRLALPLVLPLLTLLSAAYAYLCFSPTLRIQGRRKEIRSRAIYIVYVGAALRPELARSPAGRTGLVSDESVTQVRESFEAERQATDQRHLLWEPVSEQVERPPAPVLPKAEKP